MLWIISDTHFNHKRMIEVPYEPIRRLWGATVEENTQNMILAWLKAVSPEDTVYHLGDFAMGRKELMPEVRSLLPGRIILVQGNHDRDLSFLDANRGDEVHDSLTIEHSKWGTLTMRHNPSHFTEDDARYSDMLLCGHLHSSKVPESIPELIRSKVTCVSVERLPTRPAPLPLDGVGYLPTG